MTKRSPLVVVVPGMGGSELADQDGRAVWFGGAGAVADVFLQPDRLDLSHDLMPTGLLTDFAVVPFFKNIRGYSGLWASMHRLLRPIKIDTGHPQRRVLDAELVAFPYDFRRGVCDAADRLQAEIHDRVGEISSRDDPPVVVVAHSMGGLVARHWLARPGEARYCRGLITAGTPHRGAVKALEVLANGIGSVARGTIAEALTRVAGNRLKRLDEIVRTWPGLFDLVANGEVVWDTTSRTWRTPVSIERLDHHEELVTAEAGHQFILDGWKDLRERGEAPALVPLAGRGHRTSDALVWAEGELRRPGRTAPDGAPEEGHDLGDSTVPLTCALPWEFDVAKQREILRRTNLRHGELSDESSIPSIVGGLLAKAVPTRGAYDPTDRPYLQADLPDIHASSVDEPLGSIAVSSSDRSWNLSVAGRWLTEQSLKTPDLVIDNGSLRLASSPPNEIAALEVTIAAVDDTYLRLECRDVVTVLS